LELELKCWKYNFEEAHHNTKDVFVPKSLERNAKMYTLSESIGAGVDQDGNFIAWHLKDNKHHTFDLKNVIDVSAG
jgi:hypothetical protein